MRKITSIFVAFLFLSLNVFAQSEINAIQAANDDIHGTARGMAMGGAFGALGGDLTGVQINPAGIAVYRTSEVVGTINFTSINSSVNKKSTHKNKFDFNNIGFVGYFPIRSSSIPVLNFGFSYNKVKSFNREINAFGTGRNSSLTNYIADRSSKGKGVDPVLLEFQDGKQDPFKTGAPWLTVFGFNSYLIKHFKDNDRHLYESILPKGEKVQNRLIFSERGSINDYDFTFGTTINNKLNIGLALTITDMYYNLYSVNSENFAQGNNSGFNLRNWLITEGKGLGVKLGLIYRPVNSIRLGLAYHSPTWFTLSDRFSAEMKDDIEAYKSLMTPEDQAKYKPATTKAAESFFDYNFTTPDKWVFSLATVLGRSMIISADYELTDYSKMKYRNQHQSGNDHFGATNDYITTDFKIASTLKTGLEYRFTPQFSGRIGYAWKQSPYNNDFKKAGNAAPVGSTTIYTLESDANYFTGGLGYRFSPSTYLDFAIVYKSQQQDLYPYANIYNEGKTIKVIDAEPYKLDTSSFRGLLTLGYKF